MSRLLPGPFLTMILADMGADVVKIEDRRPAITCGTSRRRSATIPMHSWLPGKGGISGRFLAVNRGKRSVVLDLKQPSGHAAMLAHGRPGRRSSSRASARA